MVHRLSDFYTPNFANAVPFDHQSRYHHVRQHAQSPISSPEVLSGMSVKHSSPNPPYVRIARHTRSSVPSETTPSVRNMSWITASSFQNTLQPTSSTLNQIHLEPSATFASTPEGKQKVLNSHARAQERDIFLCHRYQ